MSSSPCNTYQGLMNPMSILDPCLSTGVGKEHIQGKVRVSQSLGTVHHTHLREGVHN